MYSHGTKDVRDTLAPLFEKYDTFKSPELYNIITRSLYGGSIVGLSMAIAESGGSSWAQKKFQGGGAGKALNSVDDIVSNPQSLYGKSKADVSKVLGDGWTEKAYGSSKTGWEFYKGDQRITYHPGGGRHGGSYYSYSSGATGRIKIVGPDYIPSPGDKATIIYMK